MERLDFDTAEGIGAHLGSLNEMSAMLNARLEHVRSGGERLDEWALLGRFQLDTMGNSGRFRGDIVNTIPAEADPLIADVLPYGEVLGVIARATGDSEPSVSYILGGGSTLPSDELECDECETGWTVRTAHDAIPDVGFEEFDLSGFSGSTGMSVQEHLRSRIDADARRGISPGEWFVKNPDIAGDRDTPWRRVGAKYVIQDGDIAEVTVRSLRHVACHQERTDRIVGGQFEQMLLDAGFTDLQMQAIPNRYGNGLDAGSWYRVDSAAGAPLIIGNRKRVIDIRWNEADFEGDITNGDDVTKSPTNAHAWNAADATRYLESLKHGFAGAA